MFQTKATGVHFKQRGQDKITILKKIQTIKNTEKKGKNTSQTIWIHTTKELLFLKYIFIYRMRYVYPFQFLRCDIDTTRLLKVNSPCLNSII